PLTVSINGRQITVNVLAEGYTRPITVSIDGTTRELNGGESSTFELGPPPHGKRGTRHRTAERFKGAIFDVDGVLVDSPHEAAWRETLGDLMQTSWSDMRAKTTWAPNRFTTQVYQELIAGKPRHGGALAALEYFAVPDPRTHVDEYARRKQEKVVALIEAGQFTPFRDAVRLLLDLRAAGIRLAAASSSKNATRMMAKLRLDMLADEHGPADEFIDPGQTLLDVLDTDVSGRTFEHGKPHPEIFLTACRELGLAPKSCFVIEDAVSGIAAAKAAGMAALGVARAENDQPLSDAGADLVVSTLDEVDRGPLRDGRLVRVIREPPTHAPLA
ncbi:MAG: HAD family hydrolase, partial [Solirubrobacteraceae bacterium]